MATRRNYATGGTPQFWRNRAFAGTRLAALADLIALWHGTLGPPSGPLGWPGTGLPFAVTTAHPLPHVIGAAYSAPNTMPHEAMIAGYFGSVLKDHYFACPHLRPARIRDEITRAAIFATMTRAVRLAALVAGALAGGLTGVSVACSSS